MVNHVPEIAPLGRFAINVGDDVACLETCLLCRSAADELFYHDPAVRPGDAVDAHAAKVLCGVGGVTQGQREQGKQQECYCCYLHG